MNHTFKVIGIDPGTNTGMAIFEVDSEFSIVNVTTVNCNLNTYINDTMSGLIKDADRYLALHDLVNEVLEEHNPVAIAIESAFINSRFMGAGMKVAGYVAVVMLSIKKFNKDIVICKLAPKSIKKFMGDGTADKDKMKLMLGDEVINHIDITKETEHTIDALSIGLNLITLLKESPYILKGVWGYSFFCMLSLNEYYSRSINVK